MKAFRTSSVAKGLQAADEGDEGGMPRAPCSFNSRRASSASIPFGFKLLLLLINSTHNMSKSSETAFKLHLRVVKVTTNKPEHATEASIGSSMMLRHSQLRHTCLMQ